MDIKTLIITLNVFTLFITIFLVIGIVFKLENIITYKRTLFLILLNSIVLMGIYFIDNAFVNLAFRNALPITSLFIFRHMHRETYNQFDHWQLNATIDIIIRSVPFVILFLMTISTIQTFVNQHSDIVVIDAFDNSILYSVILYQFLIMSDVFTHNVFLIKKAMKKYRQVFVLNMLGIVGYAFFLIVNIISNSFGDNLIELGIMYCIIGSFLMINHTYKDYLVVDHIDPHHEVSRKGRIFKNQSTDIDLLTGVYKREYFIRNIKTFDSKDKNTSVVIIKMTGLKLINESFGYEQGDEILQEIALILSEMFADSTIARTGGSQFVITQSNLTEDELSEKIKIIEDLCKDRDGFIVNVYFGMFMKGDANLSLEQLYARAEEDLYYNQMLINRKDQRKLSNSLWNNFGKLFPALSVHLDRCANLAEAFGKHLKMSEDELTDLRNAALLHDIALTIKPKMVKYKIAFENDFEETSYKNHASKGYDIALESGISSNTAKAILCHHENINGTGYPHGLMGEQIPYIAQITTLVDFVDMLMHYDNEVDSLENTLMSKIDIEFSKEIVYNMIGFLKKTKIIKEN